MARTAIPWWPGSERAFLLGTALRLARGARRKALRLPLALEPGDRVPQPPKAESQAMTLELLDRVLCQLDASLVEVFVLFDVEGFSSPEIASALGVAAGRSDQIPAELKARMAHALGAQAAASMGTSATTGADAAASAGGLLFSKTGLWGVLTLALIAGAAGFHALRGSAPAHADRGPSANPTSSSPCGA